MKAIKVNGHRLPYTSTDDTPLLWILRDDLQMTGTKYSCGKGLCGSCTVLVDGQPTRACITPVGQVANKSIRTIEGLTPKSDDEALHPVQQAWCDLNVPQCGYCQSGQIMAAVALLESQPQPDKDAIRSHMSGNLCRCGTYPRIEKAIARAAEKLADQKKGAAHDHDQ